jgi:hypothetical protein
VAPLLIHVLGLLLGTLGLGAWCLALAVGLGFPLATRLAPRNGAATRVALAFLLGSALLAYAVLGVGLAGGLRPLPLLGLLAALSAPGLCYRRRIAAHLAAMAADLRAAYGRSAPPERGLMWLAASLTCLSLLVPFLPVTSADALAYSTAIPARFAQDAGMRFYPDSYESTLALLNETLHAIGYTLGLRPTGVWFEVGAQVLLPFAAADAYRALWGDDRRACAYLFGVALLVTPLVQLMPFMTKGHLVEMLAIVAAVTLVLDAPTRGCWAGASACVAVAAATKFIAVLGLVPLLAPSVVLAVWWQRRTPRAIALAGVTALTLAMLLAAPFYVRNFVWTGNPLFPVSVGGFTSPFHLRHHDAWISSVYDVDSGFGRFPTDLVLWWFRVSILPIHGWASYVGPFALAFLPLGLFARPRPRRALDLWLGFLAATVVLFLLSSQFARYFLAPLVAMTALGVAGWDAQRDARRSAYWAGVVILAALGVLLTLPLKGYGLLTHGPALLSRAGEARVLASMTPWYADFERIRTLVPPEEPVLCMLRNCQYLANYRREDSFFRLAEAHEDEAGRIDPRPVWRGLRNLGVRHVVMRGKALPGDGNDTPATTLLEWLARCGGRVVYRNPAAWFGTRDPRHTDTGVVVLVELRDMLDGQAESLAGPCRAPIAPW